MGMLFKLLTSACTSVRQSPVLRRVFCLLGPVAVVRFIGIAVCFISLMTGLYFLCYSLKQRIFQGFGYKLAKRLSQMMNSIACAIAGMKVKVKGKGNLDCMSDESLVV